VIDGEPKLRDCRVGFRWRGVELAVATVNRDRESLRAELELERRAFALSI